jgi:hypothetical protein
MARKNRKKEREINNIMFELWEQQPWESEDWF